MAAFLEKRGDFVNTETHPCPGSTPDEISGAEALIPGTGYL